MINRECKICGTKFYVKTSNIRKVYCSKTCKITADKQTLKAKYDANPELARKRAREGYYQKHDDNKRSARERMRQARISNPERFKELKLKSTYGISMVEFTTLLISQEYKCAICAKRLSGKVNSGDLKAYVDHNHETGTVRGILCVYCNSLIGYCREDRIVLHLAIDYLKKFGK
jgi:DNA-directed RNA polymerase subunit RPC12/RpoP